jgi:hypothetical protein
MAFLSHPPPTIAFYVRFMSCARFEWICARQICSKSNLGMAFTASLITMRVSEAVRGRINLHFVVKLILSLPSCHTEAMPASNVARIVKLNRKLD